MKRDITIALIILFILSSIRLFAQDEMLKEIRPLKAFSAISVGSFVNLYLKKGNPENAAIEVSSKELQDRLVVEVTGNTLHIRLKDTDNGALSAGKNHKINVYVIYKHLNSIQASGASKVYASSNIEEPNLKLQASGAAKLFLKIKAEETDIEASGAGELVLKGQSRKLKAATSGASHLKAFELNAEEVVAGSSGASHINVTASKSIEAKASGVSGINYKGDPKVISRDVSRLASLNKY